VAENVRDLVQRCLAGDESAMVELVDCFSGQVFGLCYRMLRQREDAEDITQETFVRVFRNLHTWDSERDFRPWLLAIAGNRCRSFLAQRMRRPRAHDLVDEPSDGRADPQASRDLAEEVSLAMTHLREEYRQAFLLFHDQHLSYAEISEVLDCPVGTVKTWVHRARRDLGQLLRSRGVVQEEPS